MKYTKALIKEICDHVKAGRTQKDASLLSGIDRTTFYRWKQEKQDFRDAIEKAHSKFKKKMEVRIEKASVKTWTAAAWILERRYKKDYALRHEVTGKDAGEITIKVIRG